ncbi:MAG: glycoside hydrolase family 26 protein [Bacteroidales bacterium]|jgi:mannan endo-1,4-beta-mannosidase|nr:glycoside hydrolase family 26 protein [Bacteroidales bacterium]
MYKIFAIIAAILIMTGCNTGEGSISGPADKSATPETVKMLAGLRDAAGEGIMFGHQDDLSYGIGWVYPGGESDVKRVTGDYPAVYGMDLGDIEHRSPVNLDSVPFADMKTFVDQIWKRGGVITFSWHVDNPLTGSNSWDVSSDRVVASVLPGGEKHEEFKTWLDNLSEFLASLVDDQGVAIPVIFRPWHEHTGSWFWWGQNLCTTEEFKALWRFTFDYLCEEKNLHNLLFAYSSGGDIENIEQYLERYPGDDYVDLIGFDYYQMPDAGNRSFSENVSRVLGIVTSAATAHGKLAALTEAGYEGIPDSAWWTSAFWPAIRDHRISYALVWRNAHNKPGHFYAPYPGHVSEQDFVAFYNLPETLFQSDVTALGIYKQE